MNTTDHDEKGLSSVLREWKVAPPLPPGFQDAVWRRIARAGQTVPGHLSFWEAVVNWIEGLAAQPSRAASMVVLLLALGAGLGWAHAQQHSNRVTDELSMRYVRSIDPYEAVR